MNKYKIQLVENDNILLFEKIVNSSEEENRLIDNLIVEIRKNREIRVYEFVESEWILIRQLNLKSLE